MYKICCSLVNYTLDLHFINVTLMVTLIGNIKAIFKLHEVNIFVNNFLSLISDIE